MGTEAREDGLRDIELLDLASEFRLCVDVGLLHGVGLLLLLGTWCLWIAAHYI